MEGSPLFVKVFVRDLRRFFRREAFSLLEDGALDLGGELAHHHLLINIVESDVPRLILDNGEEL